MDEQEFLKDIFSETDPRDFKRKSITKIITRYSTKELMGIATTIPGGLNMPINNLIEKLTDGRFDPSKENGETRQVHMLMNGDLWKPFVECQKILRVKDFSEEKDKDLDILYISWDLRNEAIRKLGKLRLLIEQYGDGDPDLQTAIKDIDWLYTEKK